MINLNFTEKELETLKEYFQSELFKAEQKIDSIRGILGKIGKKYGKAQKNEKKAGKRGRGKANIIASLLPVSDIERKKPGRKPKAIKEIESLPQGKTLKKRGRPPKVKAEVSMGAVKEVKMLAVKSAPKVKKVNQKGLTSKKATKFLKPAVATEIVKRKPGRPRKNTESLTDAKKVKVPATTLKAVQNPTGSKKPQIKASVKVVKKKETKTPKIPWGDWILAVLRDSEANLTQEQIFKAVSDRLKLSGEEFNAAEIKLKDQMTKLMKAKKILPDSESEKPAFSLKIVGKGIK